MQLLKRIRTWLAKFSATSTSEDIHLTADPLLWSSSEHLELVGDVSANGLGTAPPRRNTAERRRVAAMKQDPDRYIECGLPGDSNEPYMDRLFRGVQSYIDANRERMVATGALGGKNSPLPHFPDRPPLLFAPLEGGNGLFCALVVGEGF